MRNISRRAVVVFMLFVMVFNQVQPVAAAQNKVQLPAEVVAPAPGVREMSQKAAKPKVYNQPTAPEPVKLQIKLSAEPKFVSGDADVSIHWKIKGDVPSGTTPTLKISFVNGYTPTGSDGYDSATRTLSIPVTSKAGDFILSVQNPLGDASFPAVLLGADGETLAAGALSLPKHEKFKVKKNPDGVLSAENGRIKVKFGKKSLAEDVIVNIGTPTEDALPSHSLSGNPFEIEAQGVTSGKSLHEFDEEIAIEVDYSTLDLRGKSENDLYLYYYNPEKNDWYPMPSFIDSETKTLRATTTHFSVFDTGIHDWQASRLPSVDGFQVSTFTGAATYSMPIEVPAGPGGLQPNLNLSYNSQVIDQSTAATQASWVGMGWSLAMNSIEFNDRGTNVFNGNGLQDQDDTWSINVNGVSSTIIKNGSEYQAADENFMKFNYDATNDKWTVLDKSGNTYIFTAQVKALLTKASSCEYTNITSKWTLATMTNIYGKQLTYTYSADKQTFPHPIWQYAQCQYVGAYEYTTAVYPETITYPDNHYRVRFTTKDRLDYDWSSSDGTLFKTYERKRLDTIVVEHNPGNDNEFENIIRKYQFDYADNTSQQLWPGVVWTAGGRTNTLLKVRQFGQGGIKELPATTFSYTVPDNDNNTATPIPGNLMHLTSADNGYGGVVEFVYEPWAYAATAPASQTFEQDFNYGGPGACWTGTFKPYAPYSGIVTCEHRDNGNNFLHVTGWAINPDMIGDWKTQKSMLRPGGAYKFEFDRLTPLSGTTIGYGFRTDSSENFQMVNYADNHILMLNSDASKVDVAIAASSETSFRKLKVQLLTSVYRVTSRSINDGNGHKNKYTYSYTYDNGTDSGRVNDDGINAGNPLPSHHICTDTELEASPQTCMLFTEKYSEFRGFNQVTETAPDGHKTISAFYQDDTLKGRLSWIEIRDADGKKLSRKAYSYDAKLFPMNSLNNGVGLQTAFQDNIYMHTWVTTASEENQMFDSMGNYIPTKTTKTTYTYETPAIVCTTSSPESCMYSPAYISGNLTSKTEWSYNGTAWTSSALPIF